MYEDYSVGQFMAAWFKKERSVISEINFDIIYMEYIDTTGLFENEEFEKISYIHYINNRITTVNTFLHLQRLFIEEFEKPYIPGFEFIKKFGHYIEWGDNLDEFKNKLDKIELKEKKYISQLEGKIKEFLESQKAKEKGKTPTIKQTRENFITNINALRKIGYVIDLDKTSVEELALIIQHQIRESEKIVHGRQ